MGSVGRGWGVDVFGRKWSSCFVVLLFGSCFLFLLVLGRAIIIIMLRFFRGRRFSWG